MSLILSILMISAQPASPPEKTDTPSKADPTALLQAFSQICDEPHQSETPGLMARALGWELDQARQKSSHWSKPDAALHLEIADDECAISAMSDPRSVRDMLETKFKAAPDLIKVRHKQFGSNIAFHNTRIWNIRTPEAVHIYQLESFSGRPETRVAVHVEKCDPESSCGVDEKGS